MEKLSSIKAHFDGVNIVPDEPVKLRPGTALIVDIRQEVLTSANARSGMRPEQRAAFEQLFAEVDGDPIIDTEVLHRDAADEEQGYGY